MRMTEAPLHAAPSLIKPPAGPVRLRNRWRDNQFIHLEHEALEVGAIEPGWHSAHWSLQAVEDSPFVVIRNALHAHHFLQMRDSGLTCGLLLGPGQLLDRFPVSPSPASQGAHWYIERIKGTTFVRFRNRWRHDCYINCEGGSLEATPVGDAFQSAHWECL